MSSLNCHRIHIGATLCAAILSGVAPYARSTEHEVQVSKPGSAPTSILVTFSVQAGSTLEVLHAIEQQSGATIKIDSAFAGMHTSPAVSGTMTPQQAILRAIDGTGLTLGAQANGTFAVAAIQAVDVVHVYAQRDKAETQFKADRSDTATRSGADLSEVPQSVTIITSKVLETQQTRTLMDALKNVSGLSFYQSPQGSPEFRIRALNATVTSNGVADPHAAESNAFAIERVEVLKGPQAILSGAGTLGGSVNIVTKKPQAEALQAYLLQYGSRGDATFAADVTGAVADVSRLSYRVIGSVAKSRTARAGYNGREDYSLTPQLRWKDVATDLILGASISKSYQAVPEYTFAQNGVILPRPGMKLSADSDGFDATSSKAFYQFEYKMTPNVTWVSRMQFTQDKQELHLYTPAGLAPDGNNPSTLFGGFSGSRSIVREKNLSGDHYIRLNFRTGEINHKFSAGFNHTKRDIKQDQWSGELVMAQLYPAIPVPFAPTRDSTPIQSYISSNPTSQFGVYAQDLLSWGNWNMMMNIRRSSYSAGPATSDLFNGPILVTSKLNDYQTTPGAGLIYHVNDYASVYASYQQGFQPQSTLSCQRTSLPPSLTTNKELGMKLDLLSSKLSITTAIFNMNVSNSLSYNALENCYNLREGTKTRGLEVDIQGQLTPSLNAVLSYTYSKAEDPGSASRLFAGLPRNKLSLWSIYDLTRLGYQGWSVGLGASASSKSEGSDFTFDRFRIPGQTQWDFSVFYEKGGWNTTFGVKNILDMKMYDVSTSSNYIPLKDGRNLTLTVKKTFN